MKIKNYALGEWVEGTSEGKPLYHAVNGKLSGYASSDGLDFGAMMDYARNVGGPALRNMTFHERGRMLKQLALHLYGMKDAFYPVSYQTGATKADSWIDIEGGIGNLFANASLRRKFPDETYYVDGEAASLSKSGSFIGHHIMV
ncbi:MAG: phenylacetic acid degradation bifunctional protein PaaZ, partial [Saprospiraceae bacterium]|nr:phenylacetic acid degradation bifunctional protein PaaZ [Saprospiraceae bacterium]